MREYDDEDESQSIFSFNGIVSSTPLKIYLAVALISLLIYYASSVFKGKWPNGNIGSLLCCSIICSALVILLSAGIHSILSWVLAIGFSVCAIYFIMGKIPLPQILK